ncbi:DUF159 family protein [Desulfuromonas versatilis]|uniref:Abasic site processing protein n=1 Tax=Desulfuromonas versatilis TaxID=2802975 RepID=A0ABN6E265_9BACT|nr:SOS response-associated peptidase [Desulfuromonas versatilis]BCR05904.1 DUF159 family protein [Desulfuromonas versatilis]
MCGRFSLSLDFADLLEYFQIAGSPPPFSPRYNVAPSQQVPAIRTEQGARRLVMLRWGLVPFWAEDPRIGYRMINARAETAHRLPAFRAAFRKRRCIIPAGGFFEWRRQGRQKLPFHIFRRDGRPLALAGLWESWRDEQQGREIESCTILTTAANRLLAELHERMPVILEPADLARWLDPEQSSPAPLATLLRPAREGVLDMYPVSDYVNKPQNEGARCIAPAEVSG